VKRLVNVVMKTEAMRRPRMTVIATLRKIMCNLRVDIAMYPTEGRRCLTRIHTLVFLTDIKTVLEKQIMPILTENQYRNSVPQCRSMFSTHS
jgi:hypothetical protein